MNDELEKKLFLRTVSRKNKFDRLERLPFVVDIIYYLEKEIKRDMKDNERLFILNELYAKFEYYMDIYPMGSVIALLEEMHERLGTK